MEINKENKLTKRKGKMVTTKIPLLVAKKPATSSGVKSNERIPLSNVNGLEGRLSLTSVIKKQILYERNTPDTKMKNERYPLQSAEKTERTKRTFKQITTTPYPENIFTIAKNSLPKGRKKLRSPQIVLKDKIRHITRRNATVELDWGLKVFDTTLSVVDIDTEDNVKEKKPASEKKPPKDNNLSLVRPLTPTVDLLCEHPRVKNIKRSLKRPHSRELQGLSPVPGQVPAGARYARKLIFTDGIEDRGRGLDELGQQYSVQVSKSYSADLVGYYLTSERRQRESLKICPHMRSTVINWLFKLNGNKGAARVLQVAVRLLDRILAHQEPPQDSLQLVAGACFWLAQKQHGEPRSALWLAQQTDGSCNTADICTAELFVLTKLKFPALLVVPDDFISYLAWMLLPEGSGQLELAATFLCAVAEFDESLSSLFPSTLAVASMKLALELLNRKTLISELQSFPLYKEACLKAGTSMRAVCGKLVASVHRMQQMCYSNQEPYMLYSKSSFCTAQTIGNACKKLFNYTYCGDISDCVGLCVYNTQD